MTYKGKGKLSFVPCTCIIKILLATRMTGSFLISSNSKVMQNAEFASTFKMMLYFLPFSSSNFTAGWLGMIFSFTPSEFVFYPSLPSNLT